MHTAAAHTRNLAGRVHANRWQLAVLFIPAARSVLYAAGLVPSQLTSQVLPTLLQVVILTYLGAAAVVAIYGVLREQPIVERAGLMSLWPAASMYGLTLFIADPARSGLSLVIYGVVAAAARSRQGEITKAMRLTNRVLSAHRDSGGPGVSR